MAFRPSTRLSPDAGPLFIAICWIAGSAAHLHCMAAEFQMRPIMMSDWSSPALERGESYGQLQDSSVVGHGHATLVQDFRLNEEGHVVFRTIVDGAAPTAQGVDALWLYDGESVHLLDRFAGRRDPREEGDPDSKSNSGTWLNDEGTVLHARSQQTSAGQRQQIVYARPPRRNLVAEGDAAPGLAPGVTFSPNPTYLSHVDDPDHQFFVQSTFTGLVLEDDGSAAFYSQLNGPGVTTENDLSLWSTRTGSLEIVARKGDAVPQLGENAALGSLISYAALNTQGELFTNSNVQGGATPYATFRSTMDGDLRPIVWNGGDAGQGRTFTSPASYSEFSLNDSGIFAFSAQYRTTSQPAERTGLFLHDAAGITLIASEGDRAPETDDETTFSPFFETRLVPTDDGALAFRATLRGPNIGPGGPNSNGIWLYDGDETRLIVRAGDELPELGPDVAFAWIEWNAIPLNSHRELLFQGILSGPGITDDNKEGLWLASADGDLELIVRQGEMLPTAEGEARTIQRLDEALSPYHLNDHSQFVFWARFTDGSEGLFLVQRVPEPSTMGTGLVVILLAAARVICSRKVKQGLPSTSFDGGRASNDSVGDFYGSVALRSDRPM